MYTRLKDSSTREGLFMFQGGKMSIMAFIDATAKDPAEILHRCNDCGTLMHEPTSTQIAQRVSKYKKVYGLVHELFGTETTYCLNCLPTNCFHI